MATAAMQRMQRMAAAQRSAFKSCGRFPIHGPPLLKLLLNAARNHLGDLIAPFLRTIGS